MRGLRFSRELLIRSIVGLVIGSIVGAVVTDVVVLLMTMAVTGQGSTASLVLAGFGYGVVRGGLAVLPIAALVCWPIHLALMHVGWRHVLVYGLVWAVAMLAAYFVAPHYAGHASTGWLIGLPLATGFIAGIVFWLIRRPDRDAN